jgi:1-acyl-sn-glycerol-3-phosphate acyltransferase
VFGIMATLMTGQKIGSGGSGPVRLLGWLKFPLWTLWRFFVDFRLAVRNTGVVLLAFWRTVYVGAHAVRALKKNAGTWSERTRGRYFWTLAGRFWASWILELMGARINVVGLDRVDWSRPHIVVSNHQSTIDILLVMATLPWGRYVAKKEILRYPYIGSGCQRGGQILIDRADHQQSMAAIRAGMEAWPDCNLVFFAEGSRSLSGELGRFKRGAFAIAHETDLPIVPVAISGTFDALPKGSLLRLLRSPEMRIEIGEKIPCDADLTALMDRTRKQIACMIRPSAAGQPAGPGRPADTPAGLLASVTSSSRRAGAARLAAMAYGLPPKWRSRPADPE